MIEILCLIGQKNECLNAVYIIKKSYLIKNFIGIFRYTNMGRYLEDVK